MATAESCGTLVALGESRGGRLPGRLTPLEAIAWIATRDARFVSGIAYHLSNVIEMFRQGKFADSDIHLEYHGSTMAESEIASWYCTCDKPLIDLAAARQWRELCEADKGTGRDGKDRDFKWLCKRAHERHCVCFKAAKDQLFRAAVAGDIVATGRLNDVLEPVCRTQWQGRNYDKMHGVVLISPGWIGLTLALEDVQGRWSASGSFLPAGSFPAETSPAKKPVGRPPANLAPLQIYDDRRTTGVPVARWKIEEWRLCVAEAARCGAIGLASAKTYAAQYARKVAVI